MRSDLTIFKISSASPEEILGFCGTGGSLRGKSNHLEQTKTGRLSARYFHSNELLSFSFLGKLNYQNSSRFIMEDTLPKQIEKLNKSEKLLLVEAIWDSIASDPESVPLPEHHKSILDERLKTLDEDTENGVTWDDFKKNYM